MPLLTKTKKFKSPYNVNKNVEALLSNAPDKSAIVKEDLKKTFESFRSPNKKTLSENSEENIPDSPINLNAPGVKEAYKKFLDRVSQSSDSKSSQICSPFSEIEKVDVEKYDFMKNFKDTKKRSKNFNYSKSFSYEEDSIAVEKESKDDSNKKQRKNSIEKRGKLQKNKEEKDTAKKINHRQEDRESFYDKMIKIQESRNVGLYVLCDKCDKARYLPQMKDPLELPTKWYCHMNPDGKHNDCSDPEEILEDEEYLIENLYNAGSIVWGKVDGWPWWPAMVEDDPDLEQYFWLEENIEKPTYYHVTFFDTKSVTRAWLRPSAIVPFKVNMNNLLYNISRTSKDYARINIAKKQAEEAIELPLLDRLKKYSFIKRYNKPFKTQQLKKAGQDKKKKGKKLNKNENSDMDKKKSKENDTKLSKQMKRNGNDLETKKSKKFKRICTMSSMEDNSDISVILEDINWENNEKIDLDFLDNI